MPNFARARLLLRFKNELGLFHDVGNLRPYVLSVFSFARTPSFDLMSNLFHPGTVDDSFAHDGAGAVPGIKNDNRGFETQGHRSRIVRIGLPELALFAQLFDAPNTPALKARLPLVHSNESLGVLRKLALHPRRLSELDGNVYGTEMWHKTNPDKEGTIRRETRPAGEPLDWILSGPHIYVANPFYKSPNDGCSTHRDYASVDLEAIPSSFLPYTNYVRACSEVEYRKRTPVFRQRPITEYYRHVHRAMIALTGERTVAAAIIPPGPGHIHSPASLTFTSQLELAAWSGLVSSLPVDFFFRSRGSGHLYPAQALLSATGSWGCREANG